MICLIEPATFLKRSATTPVIDVRAPVEFRQGHIPGAVTIPLFDDKNRAAVGTLYKNEGHDAAVELGYELANPLRDHYLKALAERVPGKEILLHCWRGGMRSAEMARLYSDAGYTVNVLIGGYKEYRRFIRQEFTRPVQVIVLGGYTGSGKTELLKAIEAQGGQVIDLEQLACHKGSVFGALGQLPQPTNEQFENNLYKGWSLLDFSRPVWIEDESRMIGNVTLPDPVLSHLGNGILVKVEMEMERRVGRLVREYAQFGKTDLTTAITKISERLGGARTREALKALEAGRFDLVAEIALAYYDKAYHHSLDRRHPDAILSFRLKDADAAQNASEILELTYKHLKHGTGLPGL